MTTFNMKEIMTTAHALRTRFGISMSSALKAAWNRAKKNIVQAKVNALDSSNYLQGREKTRLLMEVMAYDSSYSRCIHTAA